MSLPPFRHHFLFIFEGLLVCFTPLGFDASILTYIYIQHKKKKNRNSNDPNNPIDLDAHKKVFVVSPPSFYFLFPFFLSLLCLCLLHMVVETKEGSQLRRTEEEEKEDTQGSQSRNQRDQSIATSLVMPAKNT